MASQSPDLQTLLQTGITAIQRGDRDRGRAALLQVIDQDDQNEIAWLWLSKAIDDPDDVRIALENVLTLNPNNVEARTRLKQLDTPPPPATSSEEWNRLLPETPKEIEDDLDDPLLCVYCARPTKAEQRKCPHCGQELYVAVRRSHDSEFLRLGLLLLGIDTAVALLLVAPPLLALSAARDPGARAIFQQIVGLPGVTMLLGGFLNYSASVATTLVYLMGGRVTALLLSLAGLSQRWTLLYYLSFIILLADVGLNLYLLVNDWIGVLAAIANILLAFILLYLIGASYPEFTVTWQRLLNQPDADIRGAGGFYQRGREYSRAGMWLLAVAQWRKAVGMAPKEVLYYRELGLGYTRVKRYQRSLRVLEEAVRLAPNDKDLPEIIKLVREQAARDQKAGPPAPRGAGPPAPRGAGR